MSGSQQVDVGADGADAPPDERAAIEERATRMGWQPREKYRGPADKWVDADEYIDRGERMLPLLQERNRTLDRTVQSLQREMREQGQTLATMLQATRRAEQVGYKRARAELEQKRAKAVAEADTATFNEAEREIRDLGPEPAVDAPASRSNGSGNGAAPAASATNPVVDAWVRRNRWFNGSKAANSWAIGMLADLEAEDPETPLEENLAEVSRRARSVFPDLFPASRRAAAPADDGNDDPPAGNARRAEPPRVTPSSAAPPRRPGPRSFEAMPANVRAQFDRQKKMMEGKGDPLTKEEFARYYWESEGEEAA